MKQLDARILSPKDYSGSIYGDWGYSLEGVKSKNGYISKLGARAALDRAIDRYWKEKNEKC